MCINLWEVATLFGWLVWCSQWPNLFLMCYWMHHCILLLLVRCMSIKVQRFIISKPFVFSSCFFSSKIYGLVLFIFDILIFIFYYHYFRSLFQFQFYFLPFYIIIFQFSPSIPFCHVLFFFNSTLNLFIFIYFLDRYIKVLILVFNFII